MRVYQLPYLKIEVPCGASPYNYSVIEVGDNYNGVYIRNRVVYRVDILKAITKFFTKETLDEYRNVIYYVVSGSLRDTGKISDIFKSLYERDDTFKHYLAEVYYFDQRVYSESLYTIFIKDFAAEYKKRVALFEMKAQPWGYKVLFEDKCSIYLAGKDSNGTIVVPEGYQEEVLSVGKVWSGDIERVKCDL